MLINGTDEQGNTQLYFFILEKSSNSKEITATKAASLLASLITQQDASISSLEIVTATVTPGATKATTTTTSTSSNKQNRTLFILVISFGVGLGVLCLISVVLLVCLCRKVQVANQFDLEHQYARYKEEIVLE